MFKMFLDFDALLPHIRLKVLQESTGTGGYPLPLGWLQQAH